jgi:hypothetical protein
MLKDILCMISFCSDEKTQECFVSTEIWFTTEDTFWGKCVIKARLITSGYQTILGIYAVVEWKENYSV